MSLTSLEADLVASVSAVRARLRAHWGHRAVVQMNRTIHALSCLGDETAPRNSLALVTLTSTLILSFWVILATH